MEAAVFEPCHGHGLLQHPQGNFERLVCKDAGLEREIAALENGFGLIQRVPRLEVEGLVGLGGTLGEARQALGIEPFRGQERHELAPADAGLSFVAVGRIADEAPALSPAQIEKN